MYPAFLAKDVDEVGARIGVGFALAGEWLTPIVFFQPANECSGPREGTIGLFGKHNSLLSNAYR